jgi:hypothetical protein
MHKTEERGGARRSATTRASPPSSGQSSTTKKASQEKAASTTATALTDDDGGGGGTAPGPIDACMGGCRALVVHQSKKKHEKKTIKAIDGWRRAPPLRVPPIKSGGWCQESVLLYERRYDQIDLQRSGLGLIETLLGKRGKKLPTIDRSRFRS